MSCDDPPATPPLFIAAAEGHEEVEVARVGFEREGASVRGAACRGGCSSPGVGSPLRVCMCIPAVKHVIAVYNRVSWSEGIPSLNNAVGSARWVSGRGAGQ